jgi:hypothetical protein
MRNIVTDKWLYHSSLLVVVFFFFKFFYIADVVMIHKPILATNNICTR